jgi:hypothetical protein
MIQISALFPDPSLASSCPSLDYLFMFYAETNFRRLQSLLAALAGLHLGSD